MCDKPLCPPSKLCKKKSGIVLSVDLDDDQEAVLRVTQKGINFKTCDEVYHIDMPLTKPEKPTNMDDTADPNCCRCTKSGYKARYCKKENAQ